ncbi:hemerythrin domain-containing protein [Phenylobacterium sp.]|jgi:hemerythrin superfamily protein|uniref:hemerythrin domain-containing protein n=1 Tax=Phenylobacterium sp. TaxID=1871053 RepID=UPI002E330AB7|nr:hemerythrin domain-containing protein [Phenylobacterium sp.]HEX2560551.1 hemerythrin domain-containing protein [Phenylobacterium sp.]
MKSLAKQTTPELGGHTSVLARQKRDHVRLDNLLQRLGNLAPGDQQPVLREIYRLVFPHAFAEESVLWPVIRRLAPDGQQLTLRVELEHQEINALASELERRDAYSSNRQQVLQQFVDLLRQDVRDEEDELLPRLQMQLTQPKLRRLGIAWEAVRRIAPTRPHPVVSRRPPGNVLAALPLSILDRSRDSVDGLIHRRGDRVAQPLKAVSAGLARAARVVEQLPGMRLGEDPATRAAGKSPPPWGAIAFLTIVTAAAAVAIAHRRQKTASLAA